MYVCMGREGGEELMLLFSLGKEKEQTGQVMATEEVIQRAKAKKCEMKLRRRRKG